MIDENHLKLLSKAYVRWDDCETGAPAIDPKRPYGNSNVEGDVAEILGIEWDGEDRVKRDELFNIHAGTNTAMGILLSTLPQKFGQYELTPTGFKEIRPNE
jgi:hypothetical protein